MTKFYNGAPILNPEATAVVAYLGRDIEVRGDCYYGHIPSSPIHAPLRSMQEAPAPGFAQRLVLTIHFQVEGLQVLRLGHLHTELPFSDVVERVYPLLKPTPDTEEEKMVEAVGTFLKGDLRRLLDPMQVDYLSGWHRAHSYRCGLG